MFTSVNWVSLIFVYIVLLGIGLGLFVFWLWALIDCIKHEPSTGNDKIIWVLVIVLLHSLGALIYVLARRPARISQYGV